MPQAPRTQVMLTLRSDHFYTTSATELDRAAFDGYNNEYIAGYVFDSPAQGAIPLYRLFSLKAYNHLYTTSATERDDSVAHNGYRDEGIAGYVFDSPAQGAIPLYRLFHPQSMDHLYTTSATERDDSVAHNGYRDEGIAGYVFDSPAQGAIPLYRLYSVVDSGERVVKIELSNMQFDFDHAILESPQIAEQVQQHLTNNTNTVQETKFTVDIKYTETRKWSDTLGIKAGIETTIHCGLPYIAEGKVKINAEGSFSITWGKEVTEERKYSQELPVKVSPHTQVICNASVSMVKATTPYSADAVYHFSSGQVIRGKFTGTFSGHMAHLFQASWDPPRS